MDRANEDVDVSHHCCDHKAVDSTNCDHTRTVAFVVLCCASFGLSQFIHNRLIAINCDNCIFENLKWDIVHNEYFTLLFVRLVHFDANTFELLLKYILNS